ncbi:hypothetical protein WA158_003940 [Blastocystis sp. Blastoise]
MESTATTVEAKQPEVKEEVKSEQVPQEEVKEHKEDVEKKENNTSADVKEEKVEKEGEHKLETSWSFWYDRKIMRGEQKEYKNNLKLLGTFDTIEDFWRYYVHLRRPSAMDKDMNYYLFRGTTLPAWESYPDGGCWILKVKKTSGVLGKLWQDLCFATIGEEFEEPNVVGVMLARRGKEDMVSVWNSGNMSFSSIGERLKEILGLDPSTVIEYKMHQQSLIDGSTFRNAQAYVFAAKPTAAVAAPEEAPKEEAKPIDA